MSKRLLFVLILILMACFLLMPGYFVLALISQLDYPPLLGIDIDELIQEENITLAALGRYLYYAFVIFGAVVAFWGLVIGGMQWLFYGGTIPATKTSPPQMSAAKAQVIASALGLGIVLGSFVIMNNLDPQLLSLPPVVGRTRAPEEQEPIPLPVREFQDGLIFKTNHPQYPYIPIPRAVLREEDTKNLSHPLLHQIRVDFSGTGNPKYYLEQVTFKNPLDLATCQKNAGTGQIDLATCQPLVYYGLICFSNTNFKGKVKICSSAAGDQTCSLLIDSDTYCRSIVTFRQPVRSMYDVADRIIFFGKQSPQPKLPNGQIVNRNCFKIGESLLPENCKISCAGLLSGSGGIYRVRQQGETWSCEAIRGIRGVIGINNLEVVEVDEHGNIARYKYPLSMESIADRAKKYLILLFDGLSDFPPGQDSLAPIRMRSYLLVDEKIQNFLDPSDQRLFWLKDKSIPDETQQKPKSALILPVETIH